MKVTSQGEDVITLLWDVIAAKGFEKDTYFEMAARDIRALPRLEGTVHVNIALIVKFMENYFFNPGKFPEIGKIMHTGSATNSCSTRVRPAAWAGFSSTIIDLSSTGSTSPTSTSSRSRLRSSSSFWRRPLRMTSRKRTSIS